MKVHKSLIYILLSNFFVFISCQDGNDNAIPRDVITTGWHFNSELSSVDISVNRHTVWIGSTNGTFYVMDSSRVIGIPVEDGVPIIKVEEISTVGKMHHYLVSVSHRGLQIVTVNDAGRLINKTTVIMDDGKMPKKGKRYTAFDWTWGHDGFLYVGTSNGLWRLSSSRITDFKKVPLSLTRVGNTGVNQLKYKVNGVEWWAGRLWCSTDDGLWKLQKERLNRVGNDKEKYENLVVGSNELSAVSRQSIITIDRKGHITRHDNSSAHQQMSIDIAPGQEISFRHGQITVNRTHQYKLDLTRYNKNGFAFERDKSIITGLYMIEGNDLRHLKASIVTNEQRLPAINICEDLSDNTAYAIDNDLKLYHITDSQATLVGQITNMPKYAKSMIVKDDILFIATHSTIYKVDLKSRHWNGKLKAEPLSIVFRVGDGSSMEDIEMLYTYNETRDIFIATDAHLWSLSPEKPLSCNNPLRFHIRASLTPSEKEHDLDSIHEICNVQTINEYPNKTSHDFLVGTNGYGILSFSRYTLTTLVPGRWLGKRIMALRNITTMDVEPGDKLSLIKLLVASPDSLYLVSFHPNGQNRVSALPIKTKKVAFMNHGTEAVAITSHGGCTFLKTVNDSLVENGSHYEQLQFFPQIARMRHLMVINSTEGPYLINPTTKNITPLNLSPKKESNRTYLLTSALIVALLMLCATVYILRRRSQRIHRALNLWLKTSHEHNDHLFDARIGKLKQKMRRWGNVDKEFFALQHEYDNYIESLRIQNLILKEWQALPERMRNCNDDSLTHVNDLANALRVIQQEHNWLSCTIAAYRFLVDNERKIGKGDHKTWLITTQGLPHVLY